MRTFDFVFCCYVVLLNGQDGHGHLLASVVSVATVVPGTNLPRRREHGLPYGFIQLDGVIGASEGLRGVPYSLAGTFGISPFVAVGSLA